MADPIVEEKTDDGGVKSKLKPSNLDPGEKYPLELLRVSHPYDGKYGAYLFAEVRNQNGEEHTVIVSHSMKAPGFPDDDERTEFEEAYKEEFGEYPDRETPGYSLAELVYDAPMESSRTRLIREVGETEDGIEFSLYFFGDPDDRSSGGGGIKWRD